NCGSTGAVLLIYNPFSGQLTTISISSSETTTPGASTSAPSVCSNSFKDRIVRASGNYQTELGGAALCIGCGNGGNCKFSTSASGTVELVFEPSSKQLSFRPLATICGNGQCELGETCPSDYGKCPICGDSICQTNESCVDDSQFHATPGVEEKRWQTPKPNMNGYQSSFQDYHTLVGYADIIYIDTDRLAADVCLQTKHRQSNSIILTYFFDGVAQAKKYKHYTSAYTGILSAVITGSDRSTLELPEIDFIWNAKLIFNRSGDYRNGQKEAIAEMFGWPHKDVKEKCEFLGKAGYLGVKLFPVHEQLIEIVVSCPLNGL
ncbi:unnamed protein product, partial [Rotaria sordida]